MRSTPTPRAEYRAPTASLKPHVCQIPLDGTLLRLVDVDHDNIQANPPEFSCKCPKYFAGDGIKQCESERLGIDAQMR